LTRAAPALMAALLLVSAPAAAFTPERAGLMVDAIRASGCALHGDQAEAALGPLGLEPVEVQAFVDTLFDAGLVSLSDDMNTLSLAPVLCDAAPGAGMAMIVEAFVAGEARIERWIPDFAPERGAALLAALRAEDCVLTDERAQIVLPPLGFTPVETRDVVAVLIDGDLALVSGDGAELRLSETACAADPASDTAALTALLVSWEARHPETGIVIEEGATE